MFNSLAKQDQFVVNFLNFKEYGFYVDIGSHFSQKNNNSYFFQTLNWKGLTVEIDSIYNESYLTRKDNTHINQDACLINYKLLFKQCNFPKTIDYLSLDVDELSLSVLQILPFDEYSFSIITIEHDAYLHGDTYRLPQRNLLKDHGYDLICSNVFVEQTGYNIKNSPFEDWYIKPEYFDKTLIETIRSESEYPSQILNKFKNIKR